MRVMRRIGARPGDQGYVLPMVIGLGLVMVLIVTLAVSTIVAGSRKSYSDVDWNAALAAAYAGIEDYKSRVELNSDYWSYANLESSFTPDSLVVTLPPVANPAFNVGENEPWAEVPGSDGGAEYRYEVDPSDLRSYGRVLVRATGRVGDSTRSVVAELRRESFTDYVYWTDFEVMDPDISSTPACAKYFFPSRSSSCSIQFGSNDKLYGDIRSNDAFYLTCGARFYGQVLSASTGAAYYTNSTNGTGTCSLATFPGNETVASAQPKKVASQGLPDVNVNLRNEAYPSKTDAPGCLYSGPTVIVIGEQAGKMRVWSPFSRATQLNADGSKYSDATVTTQCGAPGSGTGALGSAAGALVDVPTGRVVYVQDVPTDPADPNGLPRSATGTYAAPTGWTRATFDMTVASTTFKPYLPPNFTCNYDNGNKNQGWKLTGSSWAFPATSGALTEATPDHSTNSYPAYGCFKGDLYTKTTGTGLRGLMTLGAYNNAYVIGDIKQDTTNDATAIDILGIAAQRPVFVWNPISTTGVLMLGTGAGNANIDRSIEAVLASTAHSVQVQNYSKGPTTGARTLHLYGSLIQRYRGTVGRASGEGYDKDYHYDETLRKVPPPKFIIPSKSVFQVAQVAGVPPAFDPQGKPAT